MTKPDCVTGAWKYATTLMVTGGAYAQDATTNMFLCAAYKITQKLEAQRKKNEKFPPQCSPKKGKINDCYPEILVQKTCINIP